MKILLTNDDGIAAPGLAVLRRIAAQLSDDVWVCAPDTEQSAASRGVSLHNPVKLKKHEDKVYSVTGTPTDSVIVAMKELFHGQAPDLILSGVNRGQNLAEDVTFSGTIAGALQGMQMGVPSIALSLARGFQGADSLPWETAEAHGPKLNFWLTYGAAKSNPPHGTDLRAIYDGYISVTPLHTDLTHTETLNALQEAFDE